MFVFSFASLAANVVKKKKEPYLGELYTDLRKYREVKALAE